MTTSTESVSAITLILSSAVVSAGVNVAWNAFARFLDWRRAKRKIDHVYLNIVQQLEHFARRCNERMYDINEAMGEYRSNHDSGAFRGIAHLALDFHPEPDWTSLPIPFVAKVKSLQSRFEQCDSWIKAQFDLWADFADAYDLEEERLAFYGLKACEISAEIRSKLEAGASELDDLSAHFERVIDRRRTIDREDPGQHTFIPELRAQFERERSA